MSEIIRINLAKDRKQASKFYTLEFEKSSICSKSITPQWFATNLRVTQ
jgi:hypothetical protein